MWGWSIGGFLACDLYLFLVQQKWPGIPDFGKNPFFSVSTKNRFNLFPFFFFVFFCLSFCRHKWRERTRLRSSNCYCVSSTTTNRNTATCVNAASSRHRRSSQSKPWHWGAPTARWTWLLGRYSTWRGNVKASCIISSASHMASEEHKATTKFSFFEPAFFFCAHHEGTNQAPKANNIYVPQAQQNSLQSALHRAAKHIVVRPCRPQCDNASKQAWKSKSSVAENHIRVFWVSFSLFFRCFVHKSQQ